MNFKAFNRNSEPECSIIKHWWKEKVKSELSSGVFSDFGFIIYEDSEPIVSGFLYPIHGCHVAMFGFPIANPKIDKEKRRKAIDLLFKVVEAKAKDLGYKFIMNYAGSKGAEEMFKRNNYKVYDTDVVNYGKEL